MHSISCKQGARADLSSPTGGEIDNDSEKLLNGLKKSHVHSTHVRGLTLVFTRRFALETRNLDSSNIGSRIRVRRKVLLLHPGRWGQAKVRARVQKRTPYDDETIELRKLEKINGKEEST